MNNTNVFNVFNMVIHKILGNLLDIYKIDMNT